MSQFLEVVKQLPKPAKEQLLSFLIKEVTNDDAVQTHFASEKTLAKDWLTPQEDEAWENL